MTDDERKLGAAAVELAVAAAELRTCDDALVAFAREQHEPDERDQAVYARARALCENVKVAHDALRRAEVRYLDERAKVERARRTHNAQTGVPS